MTTVIDLCAGGAGGFDHAARTLGLDPLGIELDDAACRVREAAGLRTLQADISALDPLDFAPCVGLVGGVPCPGFSTAGKGIGRAAIPFFTEAIGRMSAGEQIDKAELDAACGDPTAHLVLEPLRWALALRPRWIAQEQVEPVLPLWEATAAALREHGYWATACVVSSETFGVPQTRRRALLLASFDGPVSAPVATHARYIAPRRTEREAGLFDLPEPERITLPEDRGLLPWVSMAEALGWAGGAYRLARGTGMLERHGSRPDTPMTEPAPAISTKVRTATWQLRANAQPNACVRNLDEPAPAITGGHDTGDRVWVHHRPAPTIVSTRRSDQGLIVGRQLPPGEGRNVGGHGWTDERPATTVNGDPRISEPGHYDSNVSGSQQANAVRVSIAEAAALQSLPPDHPWDAAGSKTAAFRAIGNAIPVPLALAALKAVRAGATATAERAA